MTAPGILAQGHFPRNELPEDGTLVSKHVGVCTLFYDPFYRIAVCAFCWFIIWNELKLCFVLKICEGDITRQHGFFFNVWWVVCVCVCVKERERNVALLQHKHSCTFLYLGLLRYGLGVELFYTRTRRRKLFTTLVQSGVGNGSCMP